MGDQSTVSTESRDQLRRAIFDKRGVMVTDQEIYQAFLALKAAAVKDEALQVERNRIKQRLAELDHYFESNADERINAGDELEAGKALRRMMRDRNMKILLVGDDVVTLVPGGTILSTGIKALNLDAEWLARADQARKEGFTDASEVETLKGRLEQEA